jgi:hypothetical protein
MTTPNDAGRDFGSSDCSSAPLLSQCSRRVTMKPCVKCGEHTPVVMNQGRKYWIRCFMCQHDGPKARTMLAAIELWEHENE